MSQRVEPDKWYFHVTCRACGRAIVLMEDPSKGSEPPLIERDQETLTCPHCQASETYQISEVQTGPGQYRH